MIQSKEYVLDQISHLMQKNPLHQMRLKSIKSLIKDDYSLSDSDILFLKLTFDYSFKLQQTSKISLNSKILHVEKLISADFGDSGRLNFILNCLKSQKPLTKSDQIYLEQKYSDYVLINSNLQTENNSSKLSQNNKKSFSTQKQENYKENTPYVPQKNTIAELTRDILSLQNQLKNEQKKSVQIVDLKEEISFLKKNNHLLQKKLDSHSVLNHVEVNSSMDDSNEYVNLEKLSEQFLIAQKKEKHVQKQIRDQIKLQQSALLDMFSKRKDVEKKINNLNPVLQDQIQSQKSEIQHLIKKQSFMENEIKNECEKLLDTIHSKKSTIQKYSEILDHLENYKSEITRNMKSES